MNMRTTALCILLVAFSAAPFAGAADWTMRRTDDAAAEVLFKEAPVMTMVYQAWGPDWDSDRLRVEFAEPAARETTYTGTLSELDVAVRGKVTAPAGNRLKFEWEWTPARELKGIVGVGMDFRFELDSPAFAEPVRPPVPSQDRRGWRWEVAPGRFITAEYSEPMPLCDYARPGQTSVIRVLSLGTDVPAGTTRASMALALPEGGQIVKSLGERYGRPDTSTWYANALHWDESPVDVSFLNDPPAGKHGFCRAEGGDLTFEDGTPARFWGTNLSALAVVSDRDQTAAHARRIARLGYNLARVHQLHNHGYVRLKNNTIGWTPGEPIRLDPEVLDGVDWWIKCLKDEGVYVWLDLHMTRIYRDAEHFEGWADIEKAGGGIEGFCYYNPSVQRFLQAFVTQYVSHVNPYTGLALRDEPAIMGMLITNENELTAAGGNRMLPDKGNPFHNRIFDGLVKEFAAEHGLDPDLAWRTWEAGPAKIFLNHQEHAFNLIMLRTLKEAGVKVPVATTQFWRGGPYCLPALTDGGVIDVHAYGGAEEMSSNPRYQPTFLDKVALGAVGGKPVSVTEWNTPYPAADRFVSPLHMASICALQGWDAPMIYNYSQHRLTEPRGPHTWNTFPDPAITGLMPAAALAYRAGHVSGAARAYCLQLTRESCFLQANDPGTMAALRTLTEQSRVTIGLPETPELPWLKPAAPAPGVTLVTDLTKDFIPAGQDFVESDTGELLRNWVKGYQTVNTPQTQAAQGWVGGEELETADVAFRIAAETPKAAVVVSSLDGRPVRDSGRLLLTAMARVVASPGNRMPYLSEPVAGTLTLRSSRTDLKLVPLAADGTELEPVPLPCQDGACVVSLPAPRGTHWFLIRPSGL